MNRQVRNEILEVSLKQFLKFGIREMSVQKLVEPLGMSTKTVYKYFENKEDLLSEALKLYFSRQEEIFETDRGRHTPVTFLFYMWSTGIEIEAKVNKIFFQDLHYYYPALEKKMDATNAHRYWKKIIEIVNTGINEGSFRRETVAEVTMEAIALLYESIVRKQKFKKFGLSSYEIFLNTIAPVIRGISTKKGLAELESFALTFSDTQSCNKNESSFDSPRKLTNPQ
ncbi:MAG TPA: TetR/AcrR family transcriptional regulator [Puia sp.]|nr:TetR/AcrR family transcriptional regulator [Puia sp.]